MYENPVLFVRYSFIHTICILAAVAPVLHSYDDILFSLYLVCRYVDLE